MLFNFLPGLRLNVHQDADIPSAVNGAAFASFIASGQTCVSGTRLIVQSQVWAQFIEQYLAKAKSIRRRMGDRMESHGCIAPTITNYLRLTHSLESQIDHGHRNL